MKLETKRILKSNDGFGFSSGGVGTGTLFPPLHHEMAELGQLKMFSKRSLSFVKAFPF